MLLLPASGALAAGSTGWAVRLAFVASADSYARSLRWAGKLEDFFIAASLALAVAMFPITMVSVRLRGGS